MARLKKGSNPIAGFGAKARAKVQSMVGGRMPDIPNGSPNYVSPGYTMSDRNLQQKQFRVMNQQPFIGGKHRADTQAQSASKNAYGTSYIGRHRGEAKEPDLVGRV